MAANEGNRLTQVVQDLLVLLREEPQDAGWSTWDSLDEAINEIEQLTAAALSGQREALDTLRVLFLPTGDLQEVSISSGWSHRYLCLAARFDTAYEAMRRCG